MYIRRKVFSLMEDEAGEQRYFSTTEYAYVDDAEQREFGVKKAMEDVAAKGKKVAVEAAEKGKKAADKVAEEAKVAVEKGKKAADKAVEKGKVAVEKGKKVAADAATKGREAANKAIEKGKDVAEEGEKFLGKQYRKVKRVAGNIWNGEKTRNANGQFIKKQKVGLGKVGNRVAMIGIPTVAVGSVVAGKAIKKHKEYK